VPFTSDVDAFQMALSTVRADGGGDYPEDLHSGLHAALTKLDWRDDGVRAAFLIADAPPHVNLVPNGAGDQGGRHAEATGTALRMNYLWAGNTANSMAIRVHMIGASGLRPSGEYIFRQVAAMSYGQFIFLTYGETGQSEGTGTAADPGRVSHHTGGNWSSRRLDDMVVDLLRKDLAYQVDVPMLASDTPPPVEQEEHLGRRMDNLWEQVARQLDAYGPDTLNAVLLPFTDELSDTMGLAGYLRDLSMESLLERGVLRLVERDRLAQVLAEHELSGEGLVDPHSAVELGMLLNSRLVLAGRLYRLGTDRVMHVRAIDAETARIVAAARIRV
jgi:hypothetical protein